MADETPQGGRVPSIASKLGRSDEKRQGSIAEQAKKYRNIFESDKKRTLLELFDLLKLNDKQKQYWFGRADKNRKLWTEQYKGKSTCIHCTCLNFPCVCAIPPEMLCDKPPRRDCADREVDEFVVPVHDETSESNNSSRKWLRDIESEDGIEEQEDEDEDSGRPTGRARTD